jgi:hypothetical protein
MVLNQALISPHVFPLTIVMAADYPLAASGFRCSARNFSIAV